MAVRTFLIADVRGYTRFTQTRGDEAAAQLASRFAKVVKEVVESRDGQLLELRGDEGLVVFESPRLAVRSALDLQSRFVEETLADPQTPLGVGIGIDSGEAVAVGDGYRGGALNVAARLCSLARAGEVLASSETCHLARRIDGVTYTDRGRVTVKGIDDPLGVIRVTPTGRDPTTTREFQEAINPPDLAAIARRRSERRRSLILGFAATAVLFAAVGVVADHATRTSPLPAIGTNAVGLIGLGNNTLHARIPVGAAPGAIAADKDAVWVVNTADDTVSRIDLHAGNPTNTIPVAGGASGIAIGDNAVWVTNANNRSVSRINPASRTVVDSISVGTGPTAIATGFGKVWVANRIDDTLSVIDPSSDKVVGAVAVGAQPSAVTVGFGSVWVTNAGSSSLLRIDPKSLLVTDAIQVGNSPNGVATDPTGIWVTNTLDNTVTHVDPNLNSVAATVHVGREPAGITASGDAVWVANTNDDSIVRIDPKHDRITHTIAVGNAPQYAAIAHGNLWVTARGSAREHRGGTLRVIAEADDPDSFDPAIAYTPMGWGIVSMTNDGLVTYAKTAGPAGAQIVPDLATALPHITEGGRTYIFTLRRGIRYSDGRPVRASDFRSSLERTVSLAPVPYFTGIVGATACGKTHCNLSSGVLTDDTAATVTIRLTKPDPDFLFKLAMTFADVEPPGQPFRDLGFGPRPSTGPYYIATGSKSHMVLRRNPHFIQWSAIAQPDGYPDIIDITFAPGQNDSRLQADVNAVLKDQYDWTPDFLLAQPVVADLARNHTTLLHPYLSNGSHFYFLNTTVAPFTDVRVRQAVNYAIDRQAATRALGGSLVSRPTCQMVPPTLYGYRPYCPYTVHPSAAGTWNGPDLAKARRLVRAAGALGAHVTVIARPDRPAIAQVVAAAMNAAGLHATIKMFVPNGPDNGSQYFAYVEDPKNHIQTAFYGWGLDFPAPSNQFEPLLTCAASAQMTNGSFFCEAGVDRAIEKAKQLQTTDPAGAAAAWAAVDRTITDRAPWIALVSDQPYDLVSARVGNYQNHPEFGFLVDQAWVK